MSKAAQLVFPLCNYSNNDRGNDSVIIIAYYFSSSCMLTFESPT